MPQWQRHPVETLLSLRIDTPSSDYHKTETPNVELYVRVRPVDPDGCVSVTVAIVNKCATPNGEMRDSYAFYQPEIVIRTVENNAAFLERRTINEHIDDTDLKSYRLLYRHAKEFAVGHGCSATWTKNAQGNRALEIRSTFIPVHRLLLADVNQAIESIPMCILAESSDEDIAQRLHALCTGYETWIAERAVEVESLKNSGEIDSDQSGTAIEHLENCRLSLRQMRDGIACLFDSHDGKVMASFRLMNQAMADQRARARWLKEGKPTDAPQRSDVDRWYPFQLAFILQCLPGLVDDNSPQRDVLDLLWFPTGGGKTEAYLGLIAFVIFLRRLRTGKDGVTALMRYTLRLLTIQQFERAAILICCCEAIRRSRNDLGSTEIGIGMWVGRSSTPNSLDEARESLTKLRRGDLIETKNPVQLHSCPWCGARLDYNHYYIQGEPNRRMIVACQKKDCEFGKYLPVSLVDEDIYSSRPTLIIATVDKFASLPWRDSCAQLFNSPGTAGTRPPELIIQDELHLISGPLGTLVGLYETALDALCSTHGVKPKIIASTATIRRAAQQVRALFSRDVRQFPPPGIDARDSYFATEAPPDRKGDRCYVGLMAPGTSHTSLLVRTYASLLQSASEIDGTDEVRDAYWTLVGYFNSLRVLGGARMQVQDDVNLRLDYLAHQHETDKRSIDRPIELTSREPSGKIPEHLKSMAETYPDALDIILATNMISVGVDIDRLGLMAVMGQPQSTSEYIQSTSRVGRRYPGLVTVMFNAARSRDRSHYESFISYHSALYRQVESASVTPFSARARDRGLHAVLISMLRHTIPGLAPNDAASRISLHLNEVNAARQIILDRIQLIAPDQVTSAAAQLDYIIDRWTRRANAPQLNYYSPKRTHAALLIEASEAENAREAFPTQWSLRDVDRSANLYFA